MSLRVDRRGEYIVCGMTDCGERVGLVGSLMVLLWPGYRRDDDDVFRLTAHAQDRYRRGLAPRRGPRRGRAPSWTLDGEGPVPSALVYVVPCCLPMSVKCPSCGLVQDGTPEGLGVEPQPHPAGLRHHVDRSLSRDYLLRVPGVL